MRKIEVKRLKIVMLAVVSLQGCISYRIYESPYLSGKVIDEQSREPIQGVKVTLLDVSGASTFSTSSGGFELEQKTKKEYAPIFCYVGDPVTPEVIVLFEAAGYKRVKLTSSQVYELLTIRLQRIGT